MPGHGVHSAIAGGLATDGWPSTGDPTIIVLHHPPVDTVSMMSADPQEEWSAARAIERRDRSAMSPTFPLRPARQASPEPLFACAVSRARAPLYPRPFDPVIPHGPVDQRSPPAYALHRWDDGRLLTHFEIAGPRNVLATYDSNLQPMMKAFLEERGTG